MTGILGQLKWESLQKRRKDSRLILLYKGLKGKARIPTDDLIPKNRRCRNQHSLAFQIPSASKEAYKSSSFPQIIRDWNDLSDSLISSAEMSDDCVSKFASLVRARDYFPSLRTPGEVLSIWRITSKPFRFRYPQGNEISAILTTRLWGPPLSFNAPEKSSFVAKWYGPPHSDENLTPLEDPQKFDTLFREQLSKIRDKHKGNTPPPPLSSCSGGFQLWRYCLAGQTQQMWVNIE